MIVTLAGLVLLVSQTSEVEKELARWKPEKTWTNPPVEKLVVKANLEGKWEWRLTLEGSDLFFRRVAKDSYEVELNTGGCLGAWKLLRKATFKQGVISFDRPVREYAGPTYDRLYVVQVEKVVRLITPENYHDFLAVAKKRSFPERAVSLFSFRREG